MSNAPGKRPIDEQIEQDAENAVRKMLATSAEPVHHDEAHGYHHADGTPIEPAYDRRKPAHTVPLTAQNSGTNNDSGANAGVTDGLESDSADEVVENWCVWIKNGKPYLCHAVDGDGCEPLSDKVAALIESQAAEIERLEKDAEELHNMSIELVVQSDAIETLQAQLTSQGEEIEWLRVPKHWQGENHYARLAITTCAEALADSYQGDLNEDERSGFNLAWKWLRNQIRTHPCPR